MMIEAEGAGVEVEVESVEEVVVREQVETGRPERIYSNPVAARLQKSFRLVLNEPLQARERLQ